KEFATKTRLLYDAIGDSTSVSVSYPWIGFYFTGMTPAEAEQLAYESHTKYRALGLAAASNWTKKSWESPKNYKSLSGPFKVSFRQSTGASKEMLELLKKLDANGIDVWICSASPVVAIRGLMRAWNFEGVRDTVSMTYHLKDGKYIAKYDYDQHPQTQGVGKSEAFVKKVVPFYNGRGPIFGAGDSQGDFNFMTEFKDTVAGIMINRIRKDDAALCTVIADYQDAHNVTLADAMKKGEIRFVGQGRDENTGLFRPSPASIMLGKDKEGLLSEKAQGWRKMLEDGTYTPNSLLNDCVKLTGKLKKYQGTKTR
ncbi:MAG: haloacid dehalogenase-like hydrolase, partial [Synergistaceae bacterium]|nr:haloacid dehalogenase-like hydrolase [Synergistaceae bacterium]